MKPKEQIYSILTNTNSFISGEELRLKLGMSRVAVWKHIQGMVKSGIAIESSPKGYRIVNNTDSLLPYEFGKRSKRIHCFEELSSTMDKAIALAREGCEKNSVVIALKQQSGRGRMKREWESEDGGLYFTMIVKPSVAIDYAGTVNLAAAIDMATALQSLYGIAAQVKWPNDILVNGQKICGILSQMEIEGGEVGYMTIGIGLNVNNSPETAVPTSVSLSTLLKKEVPRKEILTAFLDLFENRMDNFTPGQVIREWRRHNCTLGQSVEIVTINSKDAGIAVDIDDQGGLILEQHNGERVTILHGDCFHQQ